MKLVTGAGLAGCSAARGGWLAAECVVVHLMSTSLIQRQLTEQHCRVGHAAIVASQCRIRRSAGRRAAALSRGPCQGQIAGRTTVRGNRRWTTSTTPVMTTTRATTPCRVTVRPGARVLTAGNTFHQPLHSYTLAACLVYCNS